MFPGITVSTTTEGTYLVEVSGDTPNARETLLNDFFSGGLEFEASTSSVGVFPEGIRVEAVSKEEGPAAPSNSQVDGTLGDIDTSTESDTVFVAVEIVATSPISPPVQSPVSTPTAPTPSIPLNPATLVEDVARNIGTSISNPIDSSTSTVPIASVCLEGLPEGSFVQYPVPNSPGSVATTSVDSVDTVIRIAGDSENDILQFLSELVVRAPEDSDEDFQITATVKDGSDGTIEEFILPVSVLSVADVPSVDATDLITVTSGGTNPLTIVVENSKDQAASDNSERLCVLLTVANDANGDPIGTILTSMFPGLSLIHI